MTDGFSGGFGKPTGNPSTQATADFGAMLAQKLSMAYVIDPEGINIALKFQGDGTVLVYNGGEIFTLPYTRIKL